MVSTLQHNLLNLQSWKHYLTN